MDKDYPSSDITVNTFTEQSARNFRNKLKYKSSKDPDAPIEIRIDSYGGYIDALNTMLSAISEVPNPIVTVCTGKAMSAGAVLLAAGDHRFCDPMARVMVHEASGGAVGHNDDIQTDAKELERLNKQMMEFLAIRCGKSYDEIKEIMKNRDARNLNFSAEEALEFGLIDHVGLPSITPIVMYSVGTLPPKEYKDADSETDEAIKFLEEFSKPVKKKAKKKTKKKVTKKRK